jgi:hypothetical protein
MSRNDMAGGVWHTAGDRRGEDRPIGELDGRHRANAVVADASAHAQLPSGSLGLRVPREAAGQARSGPDGTLVVRFGNAHCWDFADVVAAHRVDHNRCGPIWKVAPQLEGC